MGGRDAGAGGAVAEVPGVAGDGANVAVGGGGVECDRCGRGRGDGRGAEGGDGRREHGVEPGDLDVAERGGVAVAGERELAVGDGEFAGGVAEVVFVEVELHQGLALDLEVVVGGGGAGVAGEAEREVNAVGAIGHGEFPDLGGGLADGGVAFLAAALHEEFGVHGGGVGGVPAVGVAVATIGIDRAGVGHEAEGHGGGGGLEVNACGENAGAGDGDGAAGSGGLAGAGGGDGHGLVTGGVPGAVDFLADRGGGGVVEVPGEGVVGGGRSVFVEAHVAVGAVSIVAVIPFGRRLHEGEEIHGTGEMLADGDAVVTPAGCVFVVTLFGVVAVGGDGTPGGLVSPDLENPVLGERVVIVEADTEDGFVTAAVADEVKLEHGVGRDGVGGAEGKLARDLAGEAEGRAVVLDESDAEIGDRGAGVGGSAGDGEGVAVLGAAAPGDGFGAVVCGLRGVGECRGVGRT